MDKQSRVAFYVKCRPQGADAADLAKAIGREFVGTSRRIRSYATLMRRYHVIFVSMLVPAAVGFAVCSTALAMQQNLTVEQIENATYHCLPGLGKFTLTSGEYGSVHGRVGVAVLTEANGPMVAFGDLNGDGMDDAVVGIYYSGGGSGTWVFLYAMVNDDGRPKCAAAIQLGDRPHTRALRIRDGEILLDMNLRNQDDSMASASVPVHARYALQGERLIESGIPSNVDQYMLSLDAESPLLGVVVPENTGQARNRSELSESRHVEVEIPSELPETLGAAFLGAVPQGLALLARLVELSSEESAEASVNRIRQDLESLPKPVRGDSLRARRLNERALALLRQNAFLEALDLFRSAYDANPADAEIANNLGYAYLKIGRLSAAEHFILASLLIMPARATAWDNLGQAYALKKDERSAAACFVNAYRFAPSQSRERQFIEKLATDNPNPEVRSAAAQALTMRPIAEQPAVEGAAAPTDAKGLTLALPAVPSATPTLRNSAILADRVPASPTSPAQVVMGEASTPTQGREEPRVRMPLLSPRDLVKNPFQYRGQPVVLDPASYPSVMNGVVLAWNPPVPGLGWAGLRFDRMLSEREALFEILEMNVPNRRSEAPEMAGQLLVTAAENVFPGAPDGAPISVLRLWIVKPMGMTHGTNAFGAAVTVPTVDFIRYQ